MGQPKKADQATSSCGVLELSDQRIYHQIGGKRAFSVAKWQKYHVEEFRSKTSQSFLSFIKEDIESAQAKESTKQNRFSTYTLLYKFKSHIEFKDLTPRFVYDFEKFLFDNNFKTNTVAKHMKHLKAFVNSAINKEEIIKDIYSNKYRQSHFPLDFGSYVYDKANDEIITLLDAYNNNYISRDDLLKMRFVYFIY